MATTTNVLPAPVAVRNLLEDLLGRDVEVEPTGPLSKEAMPTTTVAEYVDDVRRLRAVIGLSLSLAAYAGAAVGLLPPGAAEDSIDDKCLSPMLAENVTEVCNVLSGLLNREGAPHLRLGQVYLSGDSLPNDTAVRLLALGNRLDLRVDVARYGEGKLSISLVL